MNDEEAGRSPRSIPSPFVSADPLEELRPDDEVPDGIDDQKHGEGGEHLTSVRAGVGQLTAPPAEGALQSGVSGARIRLAA